MKLLVKFDGDDVESIRDKISSGLIGYATDLMGPRGKSTVWLFTVNGDVIVVHTRMTDVEGWNEVGALVFKLMKEKSIFPVMIPLPLVWRSIFEIKKLIIEQDHFLAESGIQIKNSKNQLFTILCSENPFQIEISAPFYDGGFLPEYDFNEYEAILI